MLASFLVIRAIKAYGVQKLLVGFMPLTYQACYGPRSSYSTCSVTIIFGVGGIAL